MKIDRHIKAGKIAKAAMGTDGKGNFKTYRANDDPLAWWLLTELLVAGKINR